MPSTARSRSHWPSGFPVIVGEDLYAGPGRYKAACVDPGIACGQIRCVFRSGSSATVFWYGQRIGAQCVGCGSTLVAEEEHTLRAMF